MPPEKRCTHCGESKVLDEFTKHPATRDRRGSWCKVCTRLAARKIREEHPEHIAAMGRARYQANRESMRAESKARYEANREQLVADERRRRAARKAAGIRPRPSSMSAEAKRVYMVGWAQRNAEKIRAYHRAYYAEMPGKVKGWQHNRRARLQGGGGSYSNEDWEALRFAYGYRCLACDQERRLTVDHVIPISKGGSNRIENIQPLCRSCNARKKTQTIDYRYDVAGARC